MDDRVIVMNLEEIGAYIKLLCVCWINNGLTKNQKELKNMCGNPDNWEAIWGKVGKCFYEKKEKLYNKRLEKELKKQKAWKKKSQLGGIKSGISRRKMVEPKAKGGSTKPKPPLNTAVCSLQSSSSSSNKNKPLKSKPLALNDKTNRSKPPKINFNFETNRWENTKLSDMKIWVEAYPACNVSNELTKMAAWLVANPSKRKSQYKRFINSWLSRQQDRGGTRGIPDEESWADRSERKNKENNG